MWHSGIFQCADCEGQITPIFTSASCEYCEIPLENMKLYLAYCIEYTSNKSMLFEKLEAAQQYAYNYGITNDFLKVASLREIEGYYLEGSSGCLMNYHYTPSEFNIMKTHKCAAIREKAEHFVFIVDRIPNYDYYI